MPRYLLPKPSTDPTNKLSTQCDYRTSDPQKVRRHALSTCINNRTFSYASIVQRLNLIRNLQGPNLDKYRTIYTDDLEWLKQYVTKTRNENHDPRAYMLATKEQRRHVELLVPVTLNAIHQTPEDVVVKMQRSWSRTTFPTLVRWCKDPTMYASYPYHLYVRGPKATTLKARQRRASQRTKMAPSKGTGSECTIHMYLEVPKGVDSVKLRSRVRTRLQSSGVAVRVDGVRVLKFPSGEFCRK